MKDGRSFFEKLTGSVKVDSPDWSAENAVRELRDEEPETELAKAKSGWLKADEEGELTVDVYQTPDDIVIQTTVAGVRPDELDVSITQEMVTIKGKRQRAHEVSDKDFFYKELYWGSFSRSLLLPQEVDADEAQATFKNGLLTIRLPKLDKARIQRLRVKTE
ncbi:MAG: Hsp20/alpha crystallin family protein [Patescibacteria group bacterium]